MLNLFLYLFIISFVKHTRRELYENSIQLAIGGHVPRYAIEMFQRNYSRFHYTTYK
jgi:hypothetical protein